MKNLLYGLVICIVLAGAAYSRAADAADLFKAAKVHDDASEFALALPLYLEADSAFVAEGLEFTADYAQSLHNTGRAFLSLANIEEGRDYTRQAMLLREKLLGKSSREYIASFNNYALSFLNAEDYDNALPLFTEVEELSREADILPADRGMYLINLSRTYYELGDKNNAALYLEEALPLVEKFGNNYEYILLVLGDIYSDKADNANSNRIMGLMHEHNLHELEKECNDPECHLERANIYMLMGETAKAKDEFTEVFALPLTDSEKATAYRQYAQFMFNQRDFTQAGEYYDLAAQELERSETTDEKTVSLYRMAGVCHYLGKEYDKAIIAYKKVIAGVDEFGYDETLKSSSLQGLGNSYSARKDYPAAAEWFRLWIEHLRENGHEGEADYAKAYERLASAEKFGKEYDASLEHYDMAIELYGKLGMYDEQQSASDGKSLCLVYAGRDLGENTDSDPALAQRKEKLQEIVRESINILEQGGDYLGKLSNAQSLATIAGSYAQLEEYDKALDYYALYIPTVREALAEDFLLKSPKERSITWEQELRNIVEMNELITSLPQNPELYARLCNLVYDGQLLAKGILLSSNVEFDRVLERHGTPEMKSRYAEIKTNLERIEKMRHDKAPAEEILALTRETDALQLALARQSAEYDDFMNYLRISSEDVAERLSSEAAAVEFVTLDTDFLTDNDLIIAVVLSKEFPTGIAVPVTSVGNLRHIMVDPEKFTNNIYGNVIWGNILQAMGDKKTLYFAPDGLLNNIGIEYLSVGGVPLSDRMEVSRLTSTREIVRRHDPSQPEYVALFGGIDYSDAEGLTGKSRSVATKRESDGLMFVNLENTLREVDEIYDIMKPSVRDIKEYTGGKASKEAFLTQDSIPLNILHIATHGKYFDEKKVTDQDAMNYSLLAFAGANYYDDLEDNDALVTAAEVSGMSLYDCDLVVLSACESGLGKLGNDGVFGLQRGFKNAGVGAMLVSLNEVADRVTADMMIAFYRLLFDGTGLTRQEALRRAQEEIRRQHPTDTTWASFILIDSFN